MSDLVRFWYGALFLFASPYTLIKEGHVRVDILYAGFSRHGRALSNAIGCAFLGLPLCWTIITLAYGVRQMQLTALCCRLKSRKAVLASISSTYSQDFY